MRSVSSRIKWIAYAFFGVAFLIILWSVINPIAGWMSGSSLPKCPKWGVPILTGTSCYELSGPLSKEISIAGRMDFQLEGHARYLIFDQRGLAHDFLAGPDACVTVQPPDNRVQIAPVSGSILHVRMMALGENPPYCHFKP